MSKALKERERAEIEQMATSTVEFAKFTQKLFADVVLANQEYVDLILSDIYADKTYYMGLVDENNKVNFYDGKIRVVGPDGKEFVKFEAKDYLITFLSTSKVDILSSVPEECRLEGLCGWSESGITCCPLARLNAAEGMATPLAQAEYEKFYSTLGGKPVHATLAQHWARVIEMLYAAELMLQLAKDPEITDPNVRALPTETPTEGVGVVEAPRGTLYHHYQTDEDGVITSANLIVGTTNNHAGICMSVKKAAQGLIKKGQLNDKLLNMVEMAFRAYDPCFGCATHSLPGQMPLEVNIYDSNGELQACLKR